MKVVRNVILIVLGTLIGLRLLALAFGCVLGLIVNHRRDVAQELYENGPWSCESVWINDEKTFYVISTEDVAHRGSTKYFVEAYALIDGEWHFGAFVSTDVGDYVGYVYKDDYRKDAGYGMHGKAGDGVLILSDIEDLQTKAPLGFTITLRKYTLDQVDLENLPFERQ